MRKSMRIISKKLILFTFLIFVVVYAASFLSLKQVLAINYQESSAWYGSDIGVETLNSISYDSDYVSFETIANDVNSIDQSKKYVIETAYELYQLSLVSRGANASSYLSLDYVLGNDIDYFDALKINLNYMFIPIGFAQPFTGTFDGQGFEITNLIFRSINTDEDYNSYMPGLVYYAMFSKVGSTGEVKNLGLINPLVVQALNIGAMVHVSILVGYNEGLVENVYYIDQREDSAGINAEGEFIISGLVSVNDGIFKNGYIASPYVKSIAVIQNLQSSVLTYSNTGTMQNVYYDEEILLDEDSSTQYGTGLETLEFQDNNLFSSTWYFKNSYFGLTSDPNLYDQLEIDETYPILQGLDISNGDLLIENAVDFVYMNELLKLSGIFRQSTYMLNADIDMLQVSRDSFVAAEASFNGTLSSYEINGNTLFNHALMGGASNYYAILNLTISQPTFIGDYASYSLFAALFGTVEHINFINYQIIPEDLSLIEDVDRILIAGLSANTSNASIYDVHIDINIDVNITNESIGKLYVSGLYAYGQASISHTTTIGEIDEISLNDDSRMTENYIAGLVAYGEQVYIENSINEIDILGMSYNDEPTNTMYMGGLFGYASFTDIYKIVNQGDITSHTQGNLDTAYIGGIVGYQYDLENEVTFVYHEGDMTIGAYDEQIIYGAGYGYVIDQENLISLTSITSNGTISLQSSATLGDAVLQQMTYYISGVLITEQTNGQITGLFHKHDQMIDISYVDYFALNLLSLDQDDLTVEQSYQTGDVDFITTQDLNKDQMHISLNLYGKNLNLNHIRQEGDINFNFTNDSSQSLGDADLYIYGLFEEVSDGFYATNGYQGGNITVTKATSSDIAYNLYVTGIAYANRNTSIYNDLNINYQSIDIDAVDGSMDTMLNHGDIFIENDFDGNIKAAGILLYNESIVTDVINTGDIEIYNDILSTNDQIEAAGIIYAMLGGYAQVRNAANNGDIKVASTSTLNGYAHAAGIVVRNDVIENGSNINSATALNQYAKIWFSINYGNIYAYSGRNETSYSITNETTSKASGIFGLGILSMINTINYGNVYSRYLGSGLFGFVYYNKFPTLNADIVYISNSINYGKVRQITAYNDSAQSYTYNMSSTPSTGLPYAFGAIVGKIHTGTSSWDFAGNVDYPIDSIYFGYLLNFDDKINMFASAPDLTSDWADAWSGNTSDANEFILDMIQYMATTNPSDASVEPFTYFYTGGFWGGQYIGDYIQYLELNETDDGMFYSGFAFRSPPPAISGTDQYIADYIEYIPSEKVNTELLTQIESDTTYDYPGIYVLSSDRGIENGVFVPDNFELEGLHPFDLDDANYDETWIGNTQEQDSVAYALYKEMRQIQVSFATTIYDLEIIQTDQFGNEITNGLSLTDPVIDDERGLITYYLPSNAEVLGNQSSQQLTVSRFIEVGDSYISGARQVANLLVGDNDLNGYTFVGTHKKSGLNFVEIGPYATTGVYNLTTYDSTPYDSDSRSTPVYDLTTASSANGATTQIFTHLPHNRRTFWWWVYWEQTGYRVSRTTAQAGYGAYESFSLSGYPTLYSYVGPSTEAVTYVESSNETVTVYPQSNVYFSANTEASSYTISSTASLEYNNQSNTTVISIPRSYGVYDAMYQSNGTYIDSVEDHYGSVRVYSESYSAGDTSTYKDYDIRIIRTDDQEIDDINELYVNGVDSLVNNPNVTNTTATQDLHYEVTGTQGIISVEYETYNISNLYNVLPLIEVYDDNTDVKIHTSYYELSGGIVYTENDFNNTTGQWGYGQVQFDFEPSNDFSSGDYYFLLTLVTGDTYRINFTKIESGNAYILSFIYQDEEIIPTGNSYTSYVDYGLYYDAENAETDMVNFTNLSSLTNVYFSDLDTVLPAYLEDLEISTFATITSVDYEVNILDGYRHQYEITYNIEAEDGSTNTFTHYIEEYALSAEATVIYKNGGSLADPSQTVLIYYDESPTVRVEYDFDHVYFATDDILLVNSSFTPLNTGDQALLDQDYFIETINYVGFEVDLNQDTAKGDYTYQLSYQQSQIVNGDPLSWNYSFDVVDFAKLKNDNSNLENILFASDSVFDEVLDAFVTIVDIDEVTPTEYEGYFDEENPTARIISVLPTTGIDYGAYDDEGNYWIIGQVQETILTGYLPTFYIPDGASIYRVTDDTQVHYDYQSEVLAADFTDFGNGQSLNYIQYRIYAEDFDENPTHYTDYFVAVQDTTNNIKFDITVVNDTIDMIERVFINVNVYQYAEDYEDDLYFEDILTSMRMFSYYNEADDAYDNNQFATSMYGYYEIFVDVPEGYSVEIEYQAAIITGDIMYLESSRIPRRYYVTIHIVEETPGSPDWGHHAVIAYTPQIPNLDYGRTYDFGDQFTYNGIVWEVLDASYQYDPYNPPGTGAWQGLRDNSGIYNSNSAYEIGDIVEYNGIYYEAIASNARFENPVAGLGQSWNEVSETWLSYNLYTTNDIVLYNGVYYISTQSWNKGRNPATTSWAWSVYTN